MAWLLSWAEAIEAWSFSEVSLILLMLFNLTVFGPCDSFLCCLACLVANLKHSLPVSQGSGTLKSPSVVLLLRSKLTAVPDAPNDCTCPNSLFLGEIGDIFALLMELLIFWTRR